MNINRVDQDQVYVRCIYGNFGRDFIKYTVIHGVYIQFWPILHVRVRKAQQHVGCAASLHPTLTLSNTHTHVRIHT